MNIKEVSGAYAGALGARAPPPPHLKKSSAQKRPKEERKFRPDMPARKMHVPLRFDKIKTKKVRKKEEKSKRKKKESKRLAVCRK